MTRPPCWTTIIYHILITVIVRSNRWSNARRCVVAVGTIRLGCLSVLLTSWWTCWVRAELADVSLCQGDGRYTVWHKGENMGEHVSVFVDTCPLCPLVWNYLINMPLCCVCMSILRCPITTVTIERAEHSSPFYFLSCFFDFCHWLLYIWSVNSRTTCLFFLRAESDREERRKLTL